jgi:hypothetical protein
VRIEGHLEFLKTTDENRYCYSCGFKGHVSSSDKCPAKTKRCFRCNEIGHFEAKCRKKKRKSDRDSPERKRFKSEVREKRVNLVEFEDDDLAMEVFCLEDRGSSSKAAHITCKVGGVDMTLLIDSGADMNLMGKLYWTELKRQGCKFSDLTAGNSGRIIKTYGSSQPMDIMCSFMADVKIQSKCVQARFYVAENSGRAILGRESAIALGVLRLGVEVNQVTKELGKIKGQ